MTFLPKLGGMFAAFCVTSILAVGLFGASASAGSYCPSGAVNCGDSSRVLDVRAAAAGEAGGRSYSVVNRDIPREVTEVTDDFADIVLKVEARRNTCGDGCPANATKTDYQGNTGALRGQRTTAVYTGRGHWSSESGIRAAVGQAAEVNVGR
jgi:hypothetical protein